MPSSYDSPSRADGYRRSAKRLSMIDPADFVVDDGVSQLRARRGGPVEAHLDLLPSSKSNSIEVKVWAVLFALIILATTILIILALSEESPRPQPAEKVSQLTFQSVTG